MLNFIRQRLRRRSPRYAVLGYHHSYNFGDEIQTLAARGRLPRVDAVLVRETLTKFRSHRKHILLMNGWFSHNPAQVWPLSADIMPLYFSFHLTPGTRNFLATPAHLAHLQRWQPIGCRDRGTRDFLISQGIDAYYSKCLTLTLPRRKLRGRKQLAVDVDPATLAMLQEKKLIRPGNYQFRSQYHELDCLGPRRKMKVAADLLEHYARTASYIVTSRVHCALPCLAMGLPVDFIGPREYRTEIIADMAESTTEVAISGMQYGRSHHLPGGQWLFAKLRPSDAVARAQEDIRREFNRQFARLHAQQ